MIKNLTKFLLLIIVSLLILSEAEAQLRLKIRKVADNLQITTDPWQYPIMKARIRADRMGNNVKLNTNQVLILENNKVCQPFYVGEFETDTTTGELWQLIKWYTRRESYNIPIQNVSYMVDTIIAFYENDIGAVMTWHTRKDLSYVKINNYLETPIIELEYKQGNVGSSQNQNLIIKAVIGMIDGSGSEGQIWIDSVAVESEHFRYKWDGWVSDKRPPPLHVWPNMPYFVRLYYEPKNEEYHTGKFIVYYDHGLKQEIMLIGHEYHIAAESNNLKLIYPNGKESFTPCQQVKIEWDGYIRGMATYIDFSSNNGTTWENIGLSDTSNFDWTVPNIATERALIRIRQSFNSTYPVPLKIDNSPVYKITFNYDGSRLLSASSSGILTSWNTTNEEEDKRFYLDNPNYPDTRFIQTGLSYISGDSIFAVSYYRYNDYPRKDSIAFFNTKDSVPYLRTAIDVGFNTSKVVFDSNKDLMAFIQNLGTQIKIYSAKTGAFVKDLFFDNPVSAFSFSRDKDLAAVALWNGKVQILSVPDFKIVNDLNYSDFPLILNISLAPNGKFLAMACKSSERTQFSDQRTDVFVVDINTKQVIRRMRKITTDPIGLEFSPKSTKVLIGTKRDRQISYWDLPIDNVYNNFEDHNGNLTDFAFSPLGSMIATSADSPDNILLRRFSYAEADETDNLFKIITPKLSIENVQIPPAYLAESKDYNLDQPICVHDTSDVYLQVDSVSLRNGSHFRLIKPIPRDTIIFPGECLSLKVNYYPLDTGKIVDSIYIHSCGKKIGIPLISRGIPRNIVFLISEVQFDPTCIGTENIQTFPLAINADPVPLIVNSLEILKNDYNPFISLNNRDLIYQPGDTIFGKINFKPYELGEGISDLEIQHSNQLKYKLNIKVKGLGIGTEYELSHYDLRFIPEILRRKITIFNHSNNEIYIESTTITPPGYFYVVTQLPITLKANSSAELEIIWNDGNGEPPSQVLLDLMIGPCAAKKQINLGLYKGNSIISIPDVFADPRNSATINIDYKNTADYPYNGERVFEGEIIVNPRLFLPQSVTSAYGTGTLTKNEILNDRRIIGFKVEGALPEEGRAVEIHGIAGLAEIDTTHINLLPSAKYWGVAVNKLLGFGVFHLINICGDRLVIHGNSITNLKASPNPSDGIISLDFDLLNPGECKIEVYNAIGLTEFSSNDFAVKEGTNHYDLDVSSLKSGTYNLMIKQGSSFGMIRIIIVK